MRLAERLGILAVAILGASCESAPVRGVNIPAGWFKGNTHTHTLWSDGDGAPELVSDWYSGHGYQFLVLSDHNILAEGEKWKKIGKGKGEVKPESLEALIAKFGKDAVALRGKDGAQEMRLQTLEELRARFEKPGAFIFIKGEEITDEFKKLPIHHNSLNHTGLIKPPHGESVRETLQRTIEAVEAEAKKCGKPVLVHLNHPNFGWGVSADDLAHVLGERFFEVYNGHRGVRNYGDKDHLGTEQIWDYVLALRLGKLGGPPLFCLATDDAHNYHKIQEQEVANPGRGWIFVRARELTGDAVVQAMLTGDYYASSGVVLEDVRSDAQSLGVKVAAEAGVTYRIRFNGTRPGGEPGEVLQESAGAAASYRFKGDEYYVRATVVSSRKHPNGYDKADLESAWTQPVVVRRGKP